MKNAPKSMISEMMKSSIPRNWASTREELLASGGPWCSCSWAPWRGYRGRLHQPSLTTCSTGLPVEALTRPIRSPRSQPERVSGKVEMTMSSGRVELQRVLDRRVGVRVDHLADRVEAGVLELCERVRQPFRGIVAVAAVAVAGGLRERSR